MVSSVDTGMRRWNSEFAPAQPWTSEAPVLEAPNRVTTPGLLETPTGNTSVSSQALAARLAIRQRRLFAIGSMAMAGRPRLRARQV